MLTRAATHVRLWALVLRCQAHRTCLGRTSLFIHTPCAWRSSPRHSITPHNHLSNPAHPPARPAPPRPAPPRLPLLQTNVALIVAFNYLYTFLQLEPKELSEQLKRQGASIPGVRPGRNTAEYITKTLDRMSVLGQWGVGVGWLAECVSQCVGCVCGGGGGFG